MKKMPCLFQREFKSRNEAVLLREVTPGCEWVLRGEGVASRKWDGTACAVIGGVLHKRYDAKRDRATGEYRLPPEGAVPCCEPDPVTGHWPHWVPVSFTRPEDKHHVWAWCALLDSAQAMLLEPDALSRGLLPDGTYELIGPPINGNTEWVDSLEFKQHGDTAVTVVGEPTDAATLFEYLRAWLSVHKWEGLVFAHPDGRMCKIRRADFGLAWPLEGR